jgi:hypothetical protein
VCKYAHRKKEKKKRGEWVREEEKKNGRMENG